MKKRNIFSKTVLTLLTILLIGWVLPWLYSYITIEKSSSRFAMYSTVIKDFAMVEYTENNKIVRKDTKGNEYSDREYDSILPTFYYRQLMAVDKLPDSINGVAISPKILQKNSFVFRNYPQDLNANSVKLYPLLESKPKRIDLEMPEDVCRFTENGILFLDMNTNSIMREKSDIFQKTMVAKGVTFPIKTIGGNATNRKEYDEGYFFTDSKNQLFQLKQVVGRPFVRKIEGADTLDISQIFVTEFSSHKQFAFLSAKNQLYVLTAPKYEIVKIDGLNYNPLTDNIMIIGNIFDWTMVLENQSGNRYYAIDANKYNIIDSLTIAATTTKWEKVGKKIFPFRVTFTSYNDKFFKLRFSDFSPITLIIYVVIIGGLCYYIRKRRAGRGNRDKEVIK